MPEHQSEKHCPTCGQHEEEPNDFDVIGNDVYDCGSCGTRWSVNQETKEKVVIDVH